MEFASFKDDHVPLRIYKGTCVFDSCENEAIEHMKVYDDDIWVLSFPRSGTTVTQEIVYLLHTNLDFESAKRRQLDDRFPFLDICMPDLPFFQGLKTIQGQSSNRLIKSHLHHHVLPQSLFKSKCKKIYVMRNPKDVYVSFYMLDHFLKQLKDHVTIETFLDDYLAGEAYNTPWWLHVRAFWENRHNINNLLIIRYEDIVKDMPTAVRHIAAHLEIPVTDNEVNQIANHCSFKEMKASKTSNAGWMTEMWPHNVNENFGGHVRKGKVGDWRNHFTATMNEKMDKMVNEKLGDLDLSFDYGQ